MKNLNLYYYVRHIIIFAIALDLEEAQITFYDRLMQIMKYQKVPILFLAIVYAYVTGMLVHIKWVWYLQALLVLKLIFFSCVLILMVFLLCVTLAKNP